MKQARSQQEESKEESKKVPKSSSSSSVESSSNFSSSSSSSSDDDSLPIQRPKQQSTLSKPTKPQAIAEKNKGKYKAESSYLCNSSIFVSIDAENNFKEFIVHRICVCESILKLEDFVEVAEIIRKRNWEKIVCGLVTPTQTLVQKFYANFGSHIDEPGEHCDQVFVRGVWVDFNVDVIRNMLLSYC